MTSKNVELFQLYYGINPVYKEWYSIEKEEIIKALGQKVIKRINHIEAVQLKA